MKGSERWHFGGWLVGFTSQFGPASIIGAVLVLNALTLALSMAFCIHLVRFI